MIANKSCHVHLVSDSSGETVASIASACIPQFPEISFSLQRHILIKNEQRLKVSLYSIANNRGIVIYSLIEPKMNLAMHSFLAMKGLTGIDVLAHPLSTLSDILNTLPLGIVGGQHILDSAYYRRIDAMQFSQHLDDGQNTNSLDKADVVLLGVSRCSKTPTCMYLANKGIYAANVPIVLDIPIASDIVSMLKRVSPMFFGLYMDAGLLIDIRRNRQLKGSENDICGYTDPESIAREIRYSRRIFDLYNIPSINVSARSIEETAARIISRLEQVVLP